MLPAELVGYEPYGEDGKPGFSIFDDDDNPKVVRAVNIFFEYSRPRYVLQYDRSLWWKVEELKDSDLWAVVEFGEKHDGWKGLLTQMDDVEHSPSSLLDGEARVIKVTGMGLCNGECMVRVEVETVVGPEALEDEDIKDHVSRFCAEKDAWFGVFNTV